MRVPARWATDAYVGLAGASACGAAAWIDARRTKIGRMERGRAADRALHPRRPPRSSAGSTRSTSPIPPTSGCATRSSPAARWSLPVTEGIAQFLYQFGATIHHKPLMNGTSGFEPPLHVKISQMAQQKPIPDALPPAAGEQRLPFPARARRLAARRERADARLAGEGDGGSGASASSAASIIAAAATTFSPSRRTSPTGASSVRPIIATAPATPTIRSCSARSAATRRTWAARSASSTRRTATRRSTARSPSPAGRSRRTASPRSTSCCTTACTASTPTPASRIDVKMKFPWYAARPRRRLHDHLRQTPARRPAMDRRAGRDHRRQRRAHAAAGYRDPLAVDERTNF